MGSGKFKGFGSCRERSLQLRGSSPKADGRVQFVEIEV